jgi:hypothetical protein
MLKFAAISLSAVLAVSALAQKPPQPPKDPKPLKTRTPTKVYVDSAKRIYYHQEDLSACNVASNLPAMKLKEAKSRGYKVAKCAK